MSFGYESTRLWSEAFTGNHDAVAQRLALAHRTAWERACEISKMISSDAPGITLHDERHFSALWHAADALCPDTIKLTPLELFIFGIAVLIHDAAHTTLAYEGGMTELKQTPQWSDNAAIIKEKQSTNNTVALEPADLDKRIFFETVRSIHAKQAKYFLNKPFNHPAFNTSYFLIDDQTIRSHMSDLIGSIAASHHWNITKLSEIPETSNAGHPFNSFGLIRPLLIAAIMRTADAIQIDGSRAPDFDFALMQPKDISLDHWKAQNRLATGADVTDIEALTINSTAPFGPQDARAWWIAYELARVADTELRQTDALLTNRSQPRLKLRRVKDATDPTSFSRHVKAEGWTPIDASLKIADTGTIIDLFGGSKLYGKSSLVPIRELIQNSIDAVRARRSIDDGYSGKIVVEINRRADSNEEKYTLRISDDGIGMSLSILTGPFLTFGQSGWSSLAFREDRAGLLGKNFRRIGKYGIGFFSAFMISNEISVITRPFDKGPESYRLEFQSGLGLRPVVRNVALSTMTTVTAVEITIDKDTKDAILTRHQTGELPIFFFNKSIKKEKRFTLAELIGVMCAAVDVDIEAYDCESNVRSVISGNWSNNDPIDWLCRINDTTKSDIPQVIKDNIHVMSDLQDGSFIFGKAAISPSLQDFGVYTIGGLTNPKSSTSQNDFGFFGSIDRLPAGPKRDFGEQIDTGTISNWATEQARLWAACELTDEQRNVVAAHAAMHGGDCSPLANATIDGRWYSVPEIFELLSQGAVISAPIRSNNRDRKAWRISDRVNLPSGHLYHPDDVKIEKQNVMISGITERIDPYWTIVEDDMILSLGLVGVLSRFCSSRGRSLIIEGKQIDFGYYDGDTIKREGRTKGDRIVVPAVELTLEGS
jgi:hypothetical protein